MSTATITKANDTRAKNGWITCQIAGRYVTAKVFDEPSHYGINGGRVSKLSIGKTATRDITRNFSDQMAYEFDRGLCKDEIDGATLAQIVAALEALPLVLN